MDMHDVLGHDQVNPYTADSLYPVLRVVIKQHNPRLKALWKTDMVNIPRDNGDKGRQVKAGASLVAASVPARL